MKPPCSHSVSSCSDGKRIPTAAQQKELDDIESPKKIEEGAPEGHQSVLGKAKTAALYGTSYNIHAIIDTDAAVHKIHAGAEVFEERVEFAFGYLQVRCPAVATVLSSSAPFLKGQRKMLLG